jgi:ubiquinone/menaquinone biosynthesis C-methylase UbiE
MQLTEATIHTLQDYTAQLWSDVIADRCDDLRAGMLGFLSQINQRSRTVAVSLAEGEGEHAGLFYRIRGAGYPIVLLPLAIAPSQWEPLVPVLSQHYCTITIGGPFVGAVATLEERVRSSYGDVVKRLVEAMHLQPGEAVLDVGCGPGAIARWLGRQTKGANRIVGVDVNRYLLNEAVALTRKAEMADTITFQEGNAEALPFPSDSFDVTLSCTVLEEGDADQMLAELVRVTKPGGRVAVIVRAMDIPWWVNLPLDAALKTSVERRMGSGVIPQGCADATLYQRMIGSGLGQIEMFPQLATFTKGGQFQDRVGRILSLVPPEDLPVCRDAIAKAEAERTFFIAEPFHCAVGTKP